MVNVKIFFGSFYGQICDNLIAQDIDWTSISIGDCMIEANFPVVPAHGEIVEIKSLLPQIYDGWKKYVNDKSGYLYWVIQDIRKRYNILQSLSNAEIFKEMVYGGEHISSFEDYATYYVGDDKTNGVWFTPNKEYVKIELI